MTSKHVETDVIGCRRPELAGIDPLESMGGLLELRPGHFFIAEANAMILGSLECSEREQCSGLITAA
jgi:hypothetical protein